MDGERADLTFELEAAGEERLGQTTWDHQWRWPNGTVTLAVGRAEAGYVLAFPGLADFLVSDDGTLVRGLPLRGAAPETIRHLLLDQVLPRVLAHRGRLIVHASAVLTPAGVVAFLGESGRGKSTLATSLHQSGYPMLADDFLQLDVRDGRCWGTPGYLGARLWSDSIAALFPVAPQLSTMAHYSDKWRLVPSGFPHPGDEGPIPLRLVFVLPASAAQQTEAVASAPLSQADAMMALVDSSFLLSVTDRRQLSAQFSAVGEIARLLPLRTLHFPRDYAFLPAVQDAVLAALDALPADG